MLYLLTACVIIALLVAGSTTGAAFGLYNFEWDGTSDVRGLADETNEASIVLDDTAYDDISPNETIVIVLAPDSAYDNESIARRQSFVERGGTLVVAENFGPHGNDLLAGTGATARVDGDLLRDDMNYYRGPTLPIATTVEPHAYTDGVDQLTLNYATAIEPGEAEPLVMTSEFGYLDRDRSGNLSEDESLDTYPVVTTESVGNGTVVVTGDPSVFINTMQQQPDNQQFVRSLISSYDRTVFDYSHSSSQPPLVVAYVLFTTAPGIQAIVGLLAVVVLAIRGRVWTRLVTRGKADPPDLTADRADLKAYLSQRHPDWDSERIDRVIAGVLSRDDTASTNEFS